MAKMKKTDDVKCGCRSPRTPIHCWQTTILENGELIKATHMPTLCPRNSAPRYVFNKDTHVVRQKLCLERLQEYSL